MRMINAFNPDQVYDLPIEEQRMVERRERLLGPAYRLFYQRPVHVVRGQGVWLYGPNGERYLDVYNNVACVGHSHPYVLERLAKQASVLNTHTRYLNDTVLDYAEALLENFPAALSNVMFTCTGSEANDLALRVARSVTGGSGIIVTAFAYHGVTAATAALSPSLGDAFGQGPDIRTVQAPLATTVSLPEVGRSFAADVAAALADMKAKGVRPAAILFDTIFSSDGLRVDPPGFLAEAIGLVRQAGGLFIADEVQPGFGRTGTHMWGFQRHGVIPDIVSLGKPMGNGHPVAGIVARPELLSEFGRSVRYFNTFGGNPVSAAAGHAVLEVIHREGLLANASLVGAYLVDGLVSLRGRYDIIGDIRGAGLFIGVDIVRDGKPAPDATVWIVNQLRERHILISASGPNANVLKIRPPLPFSHEHADMFLAQLDEVLAGL